MGDYGGGVGGKRNLFSFCSTACRGSIKILMPVLKPEELTTIDMLLARTAVEHESSTLLVLQVELIL